MDLVGKVAVVTGGASGIGRAIAEELAARRCRVMVADLDLDRAMAVAADLGGPALATKCDVSDHASVAALADRVESTLGPVDLVFANAGVSFGGVLINGTPEQFDWVFGINSRGVWNTVSVFAKRLMAADRPGRLCVTASEHALGFQHPGSGFYTASKHAALGLCEIFRAELPESISISAFCPGLTATDLHHSQRHSPWGPADPAASEFGGKILGQGMPADVVAKAAVDGTMRGDFYVVSHAVSAVAARRRWDEIETAFAAQAPWTEDAAKYDVMRVIGELQGGGQ
ncbi:SDR family NAD(P)-dependent oxidoreductase [Novosphingobium sp. PASSN1]|uniref:SDR family NAD(P)-dependent oxidoreductase n=1 Tax=Novosphingobium sp. PASSN1 TaxID=2015561 RepID=UPI0025D1499F|nr:SDR family NAD(P)-dependent oxidoreductase [Novosphingobium sp. PASSN1]